MSAVLLRAAVRDDAEVFGWHRAAVWQEVGGYGNEIVAFAPTWTAYLKHALADGSYCGVIATVDESIAGSAGMHIKSCLPRPESPSTREARVQGVYVLPAHRGRGIARVMMEYIIAASRARGIMRLTLHPSDEARPLYEGLGFCAVDEMVLPTY
ncbi:MAG: GNAT family N-acetyltransferase [Candidatus Velthaea sp.]